MNITTAEAPELAHLHGEHATVAHFIRKLRVRYFRIHAARPGAPKLAAGSIFQKHTARGEYEIILGNLTTID